VVLVDTTVIIDFLKGKETDKTRILESILIKRIPYAISSYSFQEILQGARNEKEYISLKRYLSTQTILFLPEDTGTYEEAAQLYYDLRRKGITIRSTIDILIALIAIKNHLLLLHDDSDFDLLAASIDDLGVLD